jgi:SPX domain protein involved in polyphosphate accumulation
MEFDPQNIRYEIKMDCDRTFLPVIKSWVQINSAGFREAFPPRRVNSLYFDTEDMDSLNDHLDGITERRKLRFRWYGPELYSANGSLELKSKRARIGWKIIAPVDGEIDMTKTWEKVNSQIRNAIKGEHAQMFIEMLQVSHPLILNSYQREYYVSADESIRLTLDYDLYAFSQWLSPRPNCRFRLPQVDDMVIEFKCNTKDSNLLSDVISQFPIRSTRHSKFISAIDALVER